MTKSVGSEREEPDAPVVRQGSDPDDHEPGHDSGRDGARGLRGSDGDAAAPGVRAEADDDGPVTEKEALQALSRGGGDEAERAAFAQISAIVERLAERLHDDPSGLRVGTLALFNDTVSFGGGFNVESRDRIARAGGAAGAPRRIDAEWLARHVDDYVHPPKFDVALEVLRKDRLLVLAAAPGTGREAAAFNLLAEALAMCATGDDAGGSYLVATSAALDKAGWEPPFRDSGYLVVVDDTSVVASSKPSHQPADAIDEHWIVETAAKLETARSYLVAVTGPVRGALVEAAARSDCVLTSLGAVDPVRIVERRVLGHEPDSEDAAALRRRLTDSGALDLLRELPAARIAARIAAVIRADGDLASEVRTLRDPAGQVHAWFSQHRDVESLCFAIAAAALEDAGYLTVSDAAAELYAMLAPDTDAAVDLRFRDRLTSDHPWIKLSVTRDENTRTASPGPPRVRFRNALMQQAVLGYAWTCLDGYRSAILQWLRRLVTSADVDVRARAAVAAGIVAWNDYHHALHRYLRSWAGNSSWMLRQAAATALGVVGRHPDLTTSVWTLLESWAAEGTSPFGRRLSFTAATAMGGILGKQQPQRASEVLRTTLDGEDWATLIPVSSSVLNLIEQGCTADVLEALLDWSEPQDASPMVTKALSVFVFAARQPGPEDEDGVDGLPTRARRPPPSDDSRLPLLLARARDHQPQLTELWARALARKPVQIQALEVLREWLDRYADRDRVVLDDIRSILLGVAARPGRHRERLDWYLEEWAHDRDRPSASAAEIYAALERSA